MHAVCRLLLGVAVLIQGQDRLWNQCICLCAASARELLPCLPPSVLTISVGRVVGRMRRVALPCTDLLADVRTALQVTRHLQPGQDELEERSESESPLSSAR